MATHSQGPVGVLTAGQSQDPEFCDQSRCRSSKGHKRPLWSCSCGCPSAGGWGRGPGFRRTCSQLSAGRKLVGSRAPGAAPCVVTSGGLQVA